MIKTIAIHEYRSCKELILPMDKLTLISGVNGSGKSNVYRSLRLLSDLAEGRALASIADEGGMPSVLFAGPESVPRWGSEKDEPIQGTIRTKPRRLMIGFASDVLSYCIDFGLTGKNEGDDPFFLDPKIKREVIFHGAPWHHSRNLVDRRGPTITVRNEEGEVRTDIIDILPHESILTEFSDPRSQPEVAYARALIRSWRFYDQVRMDRDAPARQLRPGCRTDCVSDDGRDLAAAIFTIMVTGERDALEQAIAEAFPGGSLKVSREDHFYKMQFVQHGLLRPLDQRELSDGTLRFIFWLAVLLAPRPPALMVLNEPEASLHQDLLPALGRIIRFASERTQVWVVSHSQALMDVLTEAHDFRHHELRREVGITRSRLELGDEPLWKWPPR